jgi:hypothetical protein
VSDVFCDVAYRGYTSVVALRGSELHICRLKLSTLILSPPADLGLKRGGVLSVRFIG